MTKRKGQRNIPEPQRRKQDNSKGKWRKKTKTDPGGTGTGVGVHSIGWLQSRKTGGEVVLGNSSCFLDVWQNHLNYMWV
jgi:hypothetical protein